MKKKCLHCGKKLRRRYSDRWLKQQEKKLAEQTADKGFNQKLIREELELNAHVNKSHAAGGNYGDGFFCGLRCGYRFAVNAVQAMQSGKLIRNPETEKP